VSDAYDAVAELYASLFCDDVARDTEALRWLARFVDLVDRNGGVVADLGCGPGHVVDHLSRMGLDIVGLDLSPGQLKQANRAFPELRFELGDLTAVDVPDSSLAGIVSRYSIIHLPPPTLGQVFGEWGRVLAPGAPLLVCFFGSRSLGSHGSSFDHKVITAYELHPTTVADLLAAAGFVDVEIDVRPPPDGGRPLDHATVLARWR
jgi:ubiquinone/menaquinone biosynthesis C-methylase UbiE